MNAQHSSKSSLWMTPQPIIDSVRQLFGGKICLDAASDEEANRRVGAELYLSAALGYEPWPTVDSCFLNPPGGKIGPDSLPKVFWRRFVDEINRGTVGHGVFLAFSIEMLQTCQGECPYEMLYYPLCIPSQRLRFVSRWDPSVKTEEEFRIELSLRVGSQVTANKPELLQLAKDLGDLHPAAELIRERYAASPTHANAIVYVPGRINAAYDFRDIFSQHGAVRL